MASMSAIRCKGGQFSRIDSRLEKKRTVKDSELKELKAKYQRLKSEYKKTKEKSTKDKSKLGAAKSKLEAERESTNNQIEAKKEELRQTLQMVLNKLNEALGNGFLVENLSSKNLTLSLGEATHAVKEKIRRLKQLQGQPAKEIQDTVAPVNNQRATTQPLQEDQMVLVTPDPPAEDYDDSPPELKITTHVIKSFWQSDLLGKKWTLLAMKDEFNFLVGTHEKGLILVKNNEEVYSDELPEKGKRLWDMVYASKQDCYYICHFEKLYKKANDDKPPTMHMSFEFGFRIGACMEYCFTNDRLLVNTNGIKISVINTERKTAEVTIPKLDGKGINDFKLFSKDKNKILCLTIDGYLSVMTFDLARGESSTLDKTQIALKKDREEQSVSVAISSNDRFVLVAVESGKGIINALLSPLAQVLGGLQGLPNTEGVRQKSSRFFVFELGLGGLVVKACLDVLSQGIACTLGISFYTYEGEKARFLTLDGDDGFARIYEYNSENQGFRELKNCKEKSLEEDPARIVRLGGCFYYIGRNMNVVRLTISKSDCN